MTHQDSNKVDGRLRGRGRAVVLGTAVGAFLALGAPVAAAPAQADVDDAIGEMFAPFMDAATNTVDWDAVATPAAWAAFLTPAHWDDVFADLSAAPAVSSMSTMDWATSLQQDLYAPLHTGIENWIQSDTGEQVAGVINKLFGSYVIGDGAAGTADHPDGGAGGWLFGDGGAGWDSTYAGIPGGDGGAAGIFGNGGTGGAGGAGVAGGDGGTGGSWMGIGGAGGDGGDGAADVLGGVGGAGGAGGGAPGLFVGVGGVGGNGADGADGASGGNGGDGGSATAPFGSGGDGGAGGISGVGRDALPALGGAGGNGGLLGEHGDVGDHGTISGVTPGGAADGLSTTGTWITDSDGRVVILHGLNEVYKTAPYDPAAVGFSDDDAAFLAANGFNSVRLGIIWAGVEPEPGVFNDAYLASIAQTVQTLANHDIHVILDMHQDLYSSTFGGDGAPTWAVETGGLANTEQGSLATYLLNPAENHAWDAFWSNADASDGVGLQNHYARMWEYVADYFNDNPDVLGYEIMNEPWTGSQLLPSLMGSSFFGAQQLTPFYNHVVSAIRAVDPDTPVLVEPGIFAGEGLSPINLGTVNDPHAIFSIHSYCAFGGVTSGCDTATDGVLDRAEEYAGSTMPILLSEFGANTDAPTIIDPIQAANEHQVGWTEWTYSSGGQPGNPQPIQELVFDTSQPPTGDNVDTAKLAMLAEPYPQVVAGTPGSWSFADGTFQFSYSTEMADGSGSFGAGAQTEISVPTIQFPNGYQVEVTGGHVVSSPNATELIIASDGGATTVNVTVTPVGGAPTGG